MMRTASAVKTSDPTTANKNTMTGVIVFTSDVPFFRPDIISGITIGIMMCVGVEFHSIQNRRGILIVTEWKMMMTYGAE